MNLQPGFTTAEMAAAFSPQATVEALCQFEAALAWALADTGVVPAEQAEAVALACQKPFDDPEAILSSTWEKGSPVIALVEEVRGRLPGEAERHWVHHGATSQDAIDTAHMLLAGRGLEILENRLASTAQLMSELTEAHRHQPQIGRTFLQHARPTTFGMRMASWLDPVLSHIEELREQRSRLVIQLGGPVGNLAPYGEVGTEVMVALARRLQLGIPDLAWHTDRSRILSLMQAVERCSRTMAKVATDIALLAQSDVAELAVPGGGSSSMPEKNNPIAAVRAIAAAEICRGAVSMVTGGRTHELDRAVGAWHVEWVALPMAFQAAAATMEAIERCLAGLKVNSDRMAARVEHPEMVDLDQSQIDRVLDRFKKVVPS